MRWRKFDERYTCEASFNVKKNLLSEDQQTIHKLYIDNNSHNVADDRNKILKWAEKVMSYYICECQQVVGNKICEGCSAAYYCNENYQRKGWKQHHVLTKAMN